MLSKTYLDILKYTNDPALFMQDILGLECKWFHKEWLNAFENNKFLVLLAPRGHGKDQPFFSKILTPNGWKQIGDLKVGDIVIGRDGKPTKVIGIYPQGERDYYKITTRSGRVAYSSATHLWPVICPSNTGNRIVIRELQYIKQQYKRKRYDKRYRKHYIENRYFIPPIEPIEFSEKKLPIDPYTLGLWLGDGSSDGAKIFTNDDEVLGYIPYKITKHKQKYAYGILGLHKQLRKANLLNNKHIPEIYKFSSIKQRESLLQGLLDSDGNNQTDGHVFEFNNKNKKLIDDVADIIRSLGGIATISERFTSINNKKFKSYRLTGKLPNKIKPFRLTRKKDNWKGSFENKLKDAIVNIEYAGKTQTVCIEVDNEEGLYITDNYIPTHNTTLVGSYIIWRIIRNRRIRILIVTISQDKANSMMTFIQENLAKNEKLISLFGEFKGEVWSRDQIRVRQVGYDIPHNEPTLKVLGVGSRIISAHYNLIILDDITDEENSRTEFRRKALEDWYDGTLVGTFLSDIQVVDIGTRWAEGDFHEFLSKKPGFKTLKYQALLNQKEYDAGKERPRVLWPEHLPYDEEMIEELNKERELNGLPLIPDNIITMKFIREHQGETHFQMQYQNNIVSSGIAKFKQEWIDNAIKRWNNIGQDPLGLKYFIGVDLGGEDASSDYGVSTVIGIDSDGHIYVVDQSRVHGTINYQIDIMKSFDEKYHARKIGIDSAAQQKIITTNAIRENPSLPIIPLKPSRINDRDTRTDRLAVLFETNRITLNPKLKHLIDELRVFPRGRHDDCIDSLCFAIEVSTNNSSNIDWGKVVGSIKLNKNKYSFKKIS